MPLEALEAARKLAAQEGGSGRLGTVLGRGDLALCRRARIDQFLQGFDVRAWRRIRARPKACRQKRQQAGVEPIGLGQITAGAGKQARAQRIDDGDAKAVGRKRAMGGECQATLYTRPRRRRLSASRFLRTKPCLACGTCSPSSVQDKREDGRTNLIPGSCQGVRGPDCPLSGGWPSAGEHINHPTINAV